MGTADPDDDAEDQVGGYRSGDPDAWKGKADPDPDDTEELIGPPREWLPIDDPVLKPKNVPDYEASWARFRHKTRQSMPSNMGGGYELSGAWELEDECTTLTIRGYATFEGDLGIDMLRILPGGLLYLKAGQLFVRRAAIYDDGQLIGEDLSWWQLAKRRLRAWKIRGQVRHGLWKARNGQPVSSIRRFCADPVKRASVTSPPAASPGADTPPSSSSSSSS